MSFKFLTIKKMPKIEGYSQLDVNVKIYTSDFSIFSILNRGFDQAEYIGLVKF